MEVSNERNLLGSEDRNADTPQTERVYRKQHLFQNAKSKGEQNRGFEEGNRVLTLCLSCSFISIRVVSVLSVSISICLLALCSLECLDVDLVDLSRNYNFSRSVSVSRNSPTSNF